MYQITVMDFFFFFFSEMKIGAVFPISDLNYNVPCNQLFLSRFQLSQSYTRMEHKEYFKMTKIFTRKLVKSI